MNREQAEEIVREIKEQFPHAETILVPYLGHFLIGVYRGNDHFAIELPSGWANIKKAVRVLAPDAAQQLSADDEDS